MATQIPALSSCVGRMTSGERRLAERLEQKLDDDYLFWYDVPVGPKQQHPDFIVLHPRRGLLILEVKDFRLATIVQADKEDWVILDSSTSTPKTIASPLSQARNYTYAVVDALRMARQLVHPSGPHKGDLVFAWSHGVVLPNITRKQFTDAQLDQAIPAQRVICSDEMTENVEAEDFQSRLWSMFPYGNYATLSLPQIDRVRWILFPQVRIAEQASLFDEASDQAEVPDMLRVMDIQQEQLARSLGDGHRVIHGVAGSGKTMILGYRAEYLAQANATGKPILVLCYNEPLAVKLAATMEAKGLSERVHCVHWDKWTRAQLVAYGQYTPELDRLLPTSRKMAAMTQSVIDGVARGHIPSGQYMAVLIDEGHDFHPEWLKLVTQMVDPHTNSLLLLYDDAQSIYDRGQKRGFSLKSVGIQAQGRTSILKINYRNTRQILQLAHRAAGEMLHPEDSQDDDHIPLLRPLSSGREGPDPVIIDLPSLTERTSQLAQLLAEQHSQGHAWGDMAVLCRSYDDMDACALALQRRGLPHRVRTRSGQFRPAENSIQIMTLHVSKGLEWPVVAVMVGDAPSAPEDAEQEARLIYVGTTRATHRLLVATPVPPVSV